MIALEVCLNGKRVCLAGTDDLRVLSAHVTACGRLGSKTRAVRPDESAPDLFYSVGGLTSREPPQHDVHVRWKGITDMKVGDTVSIRIIETEKADRARYRYRAKKRKKPKAGARSV